MKTFNEFVETKHLDADIKECALVLSEMEVDAEEFITKLLENTDFAEAWGDWLKGVGNKVAGAATRWGSAAGQLGKSLVDGGLKSGLRQAADTVSGPTVKFDKAEQVLKDLADFLNSNEQTKKMPAVGKQGMTVGQYINGVLNLLKKEKENIPKMMQAQVSQNYAARGGSEGQEKASPIVDTQGNPFMRKVS
jgi:hypothetical protein